LNKNKLFCIAHAAGSALNYYQWKRYLDDSFEIVPLELAGRGAKFKQHRYEDMKEITEGLWREIADQIGNEPYFIYGHSFGSWIAYELYYKIAGENVRKPSAIFFSGMQSPLTHKDCYTVNDLSDESLLKLFDHFGGTDLDVLTNDSMREHYIGLMRADYNVLSKYIPTKSFELVESDMYILSGIEDHSVTDQGLLAWKNLCLVRFQINKIAGAHFFPFTNAKETAKLVNKLCSEYLVND